MNGKPFFIHNMVIMLLVLNMSFPLTVEFPSWNLIISVYSVCGIYLAGSHSAEVFHVLVVVKFIHIPGMWGCPLHRRILWCFSERLIGHSRNYEESSTSDIKNTKIAVSCEGNVFIRKANLTRDSSPRKRRKWTVRAMSFHTPESPPPSLAKRSHNPSPASHDPIVSL